MDRYEGEQWIMVKKKIELMELYEETDPKVLIELQEILVRGKRGQLIPIGLISLGPILILLIQIHENDTKDLILTVILSLITTGYFLYSWISYRKEMSGLELIKKRYLAEMNTN